jgi:molybdopterin converting factor small subunit
MNIFHCNVKLYASIREHSGWNNWSMLITEKYPCLNSYEARLRERYWKEQLNANLNSNRILVTADERKQILAEKQKQKQLKKANKDAENKLYYGF